MPRAHKPIRWTIERAASEFGLDRKTLSKRITAKGVTAGDDGFFSTREISVAVFSDGEAARNALTAAQTENFELKNKKLAGQLAESALFQQISDSLILEIRQKITDSEIPEHIKSEFLRDIQKINIDEMVKNNSPGNDPDLEDEPPVG